MRFRKEYSILVILFMLSLIAGGCGNKVSSSGEDTYIGQIEKWSNENLQQVSNYTEINSLVYLMLDEDGNELYRTEGSSERIVFYDPYKTKTTTLSETDYAAEPLYEIHKNDSIITYTYFLQDETYLVSEFAREDLSSQEEIEVFDYQYIDLGERRPGLLSGMVDYEVIEDNDEQVVIRATIDPEDVYGTASGYMYTKSWTKTIYYNKNSQQVVKVEGHLIINAEELMPNFEIDGKSVTENDITIVTEYRDINSSQEFDLPEGSELSN